MKGFLTTGLWLHLVLFLNHVEAQSWIRINQLGYLPDAIKVAVMVSKDRIHSLNPFWS